MEDIFDQMRKLFESQFKGIFPQNSEEFDPEDLTEPSDQSNQNHKDNPQSKSYSISYRFGTDMDKPEIKVNGDIDEESIRNMLSNFGPFSGMIGFKTPAIIEPEKPKTKKPTPGLDHEEPFTDILENDQGADVVLEMAGVVTEDIRIQHEDQKIIITAATPYKKYRAEIKLGFKPLPDPKILSNNGIITIEFRK